MILLSLISTSGQAVKAADNPSDRHQAGLHWAERTLGIAQLKSSDVAGDASLRRYFRLFADKQSWVLMDAPPQHEDCRPFVEIAERLSQAGLHAPEIVASDLENGFLLLEDLGNVQLRERLTTNNTDEYFPPLFQLLARMATDVNAEGLSPYDRSRLQEELEWFPRWYLKKHKRISLDCHGWDIWEDLCTRLMASAQTQPQVFVHRDFHSCNLMLAPDGSIGVIDFQDAVCGPISYDFISLLWDRYIHWPRARLEAWMEEFRVMVAPQISPEDWVRSCDWMGLQRNLKVVGIFARLYYRDGKQGYLEMIPQFFSYLTDVLPLYPELESFNSLLEELQCAP